MVRLFRSYRNRRRYRAAAAEAAQAGGVVCGTILPSGEPRYFVMPASASDEEVRARAFEEREGRPMDSWERLVLSLAARRQRAQA